VRLVPYAATTAATLPVAPGWPHDDTAAALSFAASGAWTWLVLDDDERIAGECGVKALPDRDGVVEIGYGLAAGSRGRGLGSRAVAALLAELATRPGVSAVTAEVAVGNEPSRRLLERLGFSVTHTRGGYLWYRRLV
jgi:RimJ/RimL family protein N-acetyltransferase